MNNELFENFKILLRLYVSTAEEAHKVLKQYLNIETPMYWRQSNIPQTGKLGNNQEHEYRFHGTDCKFHYENYEIDFTFGFDGRVGGIDPWKLYRFAEEGPRKFSELNDEKIIRKLILEAEKTGLVSRPFKEYQDDLYYLNS